MDHGKLSELIMEQISYSVSQNCNLLNLKQEKIDVYTRISWDYFPHDHAQLRAYRWGEDGLLGISDEQCRLCFSLCLWNGNDPKYVSDTDFT